MTRSKVAQQNSDSNRISELEDPVRALQEDSRRNKKELTQKIEGECKKNKEELSQKIEDFVNLILGEMRAFMALQRGRKNKDIEGGDEGGNFLSSLGGKGILETSRRED